MSWNCAVGAGGPSTEQSIEHAMLGLLGAKQALADGLLDGLGEIGA